MDGSEPPSAPLSARILVIGYGSPIRGDDAIGPLVADRLARDGVPAGVTVLSRHILTAELVADLIERDRVIFLDAAVAGAPGTVRCQRLHPDAHAISTMAHFLDPRELLAWCETLYGRVPETYLVTVTGASFDYDHYRLTPQAEAAIPRMLELIRALMLGTAPDQAGCHGGDRPAEHEPAARV